MILSSLFSVAILLVVLIIIEGMFALGMAAEMVRA